MNTVIVHPINGAKVTFSEAELKEDLKNGWSIYEYKIDSSLVEIESSKEKSEVKTNLSMDAKNQR